MTLRRRLALLATLLLAPIALVGCPSPVDDDDSADESVDDDDSAADDDDAVDDDDASGCDARFPFTIDVTGNQTSTLAFTQALCDPQGADVWQWRYETEDDWFLIVRAGPLQGSGTTYDTQAGSPGSMVVTLAEQGVDGITYNWLSSNASHADRNATIDLQLYEGADGPPACGFLTVDALGTFDDRMVTLGPQPIPLACP